MKIPSNKKIAEGIHLCIENAERFLESARLLLNNKCYRDAYLLTLYALEEMGKVILILNLPFHVETEEEFSKWKQRFKDHKEKFWFSKDLDDIMEQKLPLEYNKKDGQKSIVKQNVAFVNMVEDFFILPEKPGAKSSTKLLGVAEKRLSFLKINHSSVDSDKKIITETCRKLKGLSIEKLQELRQKEFSG